MTRESTMFANQQQAESFRRSAKTNILKLFRNESTYQADEVCQLVSGLNQMSMASKLNAKGANTQLRGIEHIASWARRSRNSAVDDVMQRTTQLFQMYTEKQMQFTRDFDHFTQQLRKIADTENRVMEYEQDVQKKEAKLVKIKKQIARSSFLWKKSTADFARLCDERDTLTTELEQAHRRLNAAREEAEVIKMFQFRQGMMGIADAYRNLSKNIDLIFGCQREITELVPAVSTQDVNQMLYSGSPYTREQVESVRRSLDSEEHPILYNPPLARQRTESILHGNRSGTPPPPYTPTTSRPMMVQRSSRFSDSHLAAMNAVRIPTSSRSAVAVPTAPEPTPVRTYIPKYKGLYPDLTSLK